MLIYGDEEFRKPKTEYIQCTLQKQNITTVSWIPANFVKSGKILDIKLNDGNWSSGWKIIHFGGHYEGEEPPSVKIKESVINY